MDRAFCVASSKRVSVGGCGRRARRGLCSSSPRWAPPWLLMALCACALSWGLHFEKRSDCVSTGRGGSACRDPSGPISCCSSDTRLSKKSHSCQVPFSAHHQGHRACPPWRGAGSGCAALGGLVAESESIRLLGQGPPQGRALPRRTHSCLGSWGHCRARGRGQRASMPHTVLRA